MNDEQLLRYSRHILLDEIGVDGQEKVCAASVLVIGVGGLGSPVALYLASAGVGHIILSDDDEVELTNLQRQIIHTQNSLGQAKTASAQAQMLRLNSELRIDCVGRLADTELDALLPLVTVVIDCSDNFKTRYQINRACVRHKVPLVSGAAIQFSGQLMVFDHRRADSPCYACIFPEEAEQEETRCALMGVFAPLVGIIGSLQAAEALKLIVGIDSGLQGRLLLFDGLYMQWRTLNVQPEASCRCQQGFSDQAN